MKKIIFILLAVIVSISASAQTKFHFRTTDFAIKYSYQSWDECDWVPSNISGIIDLNTERIIINSPNKQTFIILRLEPNTPRTELVFHCLDKNYVRCNIRVVTGNQKQIYIYYSDITYVYNIRVTQAI